MTKSLKEHNRPITISTKDKELHLKRDDYEIMSKPKDVSLDDINLTQRDQLLKDCELIIKKPDLLGKSKWELVFVGRLIDAKIEDEEFLSQVRDGRIKLSGGDSLICDLLVSTSIDRHFNVASVDYTVKKMQGLKNKQEQYSFGFYK